MNLRKKFIKSTKIGREWFNPGNFPSSVLVETTSVCNEKCLFCPRTYSEREMKHIDKKMFIKILEEVKKEKPNLKNFGLQCFGEPLINPEWFDLINLVKEYLPNTYVHMGTNSLLLTKENTRKILESGLDKIGISEKRGYFGSKKIFRKNREKIKYFLKKAKNKNIDVSVQMILFKDNKKEVKEFIKTWEPYLSKNIKLTITESHDWGGYIPKNFDKIINRAKWYNIKVPCHMPFNLCLIHNDGKVVPCCFDIDAKLQVGKFPEQSIKDIWDGEKYNKLREKLLSAEIDKDMKCWNCNHYRRSPINVAKAFLFGKDPNTKTIKK